MDWRRILAYITGTVDQELLLRNEYLVAENRILRQQVNGRLLLSDAEKKTLAEIGYRIGWKTLEDVANAAKLDTILGWYRKLLTQKFDGSKARRKVGRPQVDDDIAQLIVRMASENPGWAMTGSRAPWPILSTGFQIRPSGMFCGAMGRLLLHRGSIRQRGPRSFEPTWRC